MEKKRTAGAIKDAGYEVVGHEQIDVGRLSLHPDSEMPIDEDDGLALSERISERGVIDHDLIVLADTLQVVDGGNRLKAARELSMEKVWCKLIRTDEVRSIVLDSLASGRQRTTGQRIMAFIEMNQAAVLGAYQDGLDAEALNRKKGNSRDSHVRTPQNNPFHSSAIAERLHVCREDVIKAIKLTLAAMDREDEKMGETARAIMRRVYAGQTPVRRCLAGLAGKRADQHGRADADYTVAGLLSIGSLGSTFRHWNDLSIDDRRLIEDRWMQRVAPYLPKSFIELLAAQK